MGSAATTLPGGHASHVREHGSLLAGAEKRTLVWLARRMPARVNSDHLTALGAAAMVATSAVLALSPLDRRLLVLVPLLLAVNWFGDSLDGTLARVRDQQRPRYGYYLDHVVDIAMTALLFAGLAVSGLCSPWVAVALLVGYLLLCGESFLATHALGVFRISFGWMGPTELRLLLAAGVLKAMVDPVVAPFGLGPVLLFDLGGVVGAAGMGVVFLLSAARNTRALYRAEPIRPIDARPRSDDAR